MSPPDPPPSAHGPAAFLHAIAASLLALPDDHPTAEALPGLAHEVWAAWSPAGDVQARGEGIRALVKLPAEDLARAVAAVVAATAADRPAAVRQALTAYLMLIPETIRQAVRRSAEAAGTQGKARVTLSQAADLEPFLPPNLPRLPRAVQSAGGAAAETGITLTVVEGPHQGEAFTLAGHDTFLVGRSKHAHFRLPPGDKYFSRIHFLLEANPPRCRLMDMGSRNGTFVNERRVTAAELHDGDVIRAGHTRLRASLPPADDAVTLVPASPPPDEATSPYVASGPSTPTPALPPPALPGYDLIEELGRGGMGVVYLARRLANGAAVALKVLSPATAGSRGDVARFLREAEVLRELDHPHIVSFLEMGEAEGKLYFAMEYVEGTDAGRLLDEHGPLPVGRAVGLVCQLLQALDYAHARGFVHRDIKPANLLLTTAGGRDHLKLADFGLARVYHSSKLSGLTMTGDVGGTAAFMPPEQITNYREARPPTDQYAAAATLYNLLTGRYVYDFPPHVHLRLLKILDEDPVPIRERLPELPEELAAVIHRALAREPSDRYRDARALRKALLPFAGREA